MYTSVKQAFLNSSCLFLILFLPMTTGRMSPSHTCLEDGSHVTGTCTGDPGTTVSAKGTPPNPPGHCGLSQSPGRPLLYDFEGNRRERLEYGTKENLTLLGAHQHEQTLTTPNLKLSAHFPKCSPITSTSSITKVF